MRCLIQCVDGDFKVEDSDFKPVGRELSAWIPESIDWQQLNYGQGEGQAEIENCEWGFYWSSDDTASVVLHDGNVTLFDAQNLIEAVASKICGKDNFRVLIAGNSK